MQQQNVETLLKEFDTNPFFAEAEKVLIDMRKADIKVDIDEIKETSSLVYAKLNDKNIEKFAILIDAPQINKVVEYV